MGKTHHLQVRISPERFIQVDIAEPPGDWFTDGHLQEILVAIGDQFYDLYNLENPKVFRTPRCSFSVFTQPKSFKSYIFTPSQEESGYYGLSSIPKILCIRVLGRADVAEKLQRQTTLDSALRIVRT
ncbi:hypothetical protein TVAG_267920 [Trichomonas vaginalis G3]|uniref:Uncharacterized protein n=1 Tax=Trichomonas vaginalis (strain ATCC PRA-98 / G3) TaxID=412133 RepID=A2DLE1_TRIV3|nr:hypothetical protein TVAGG3_0013950 [Trichomonas vaginalis G3]EAY18759.1 hypothetical protein TVAG_267920 [Trichomonas vaginalis G3]KAI5539305.1 hypothetical protein TVAGG3_0013950 [Trichomonas vaginalis G3]|eukprot:XP_001579745.1 hypothetical protein [Trichomonas vaginalis G3]